MHQLNLSQITNYHHHHYHHHEEFLNEIEDPDMIAYRLHAMQPRRRNEVIHQERRQETNEVTSLITELNKSNLSETSQNNEEHLIQQNQNVTQQPQPVTQQSQLAEASAVNCLFCGKHFAKKGKWLTKHQDTCSQNPDNQN